MLPNLTNQLPLYPFNRNHSVDPPPRYSLSDFRRLRYDSSFVFLCAFFAFCVLVLLFLIVLGLVPVRIQLDHVVASCTATPLTSWRILNSTAVEVDYFFLFDPNIQCTLSFLNQKPNSWTRKIPPPNTRVSSARSNRSVSFNIWRNILPMPVLCHLNCL